MLAISVWTGGCTQYTTVHETTPQQESSLPAECPDISGNYAGAGRMVRGDATQQIGSRLTIDFAFPIGDAEAWKAMVSRYKRNDHGVVIPPDYVSVRQPGEGEYVVAAFYGDVKIGEYRTGYAKTTQIICQSGVMYRKYKREDVRSDYGPNRVTTEDILRIDGNGDLLSRRSMDVEYHALLFNLPMGTGHFFEEYKFSRVAR